MKSLPRHTTTIQRICHKVNIYSINSLNGHAFTLIISSVELSGKLHLDNFFIGKIDQLVQPATGTPQKPHFMAAPALYLLARPLFGGLSGFIKYPARCDYLTSQLIHFDYIFASQIAWVFMFWHANL